MNRWTHRLTFALISATVLLTPAVFAQTRGDDQPRTGQAQPRTGQASDDDKKRADQDKKRAEQDKKRAEQDKKRENDQRAEARRRDDERRRAEDQRRRTPRPDRVVFVGGYFYDPYYGPFPWWPPANYPLRFAHGDRAQIRVQVSPDSAAVYVDGFYAGVVDDFDGFFQALPVLPGGHTIALYLDGYKTVNRGIYLPPGSTFRLKEELTPLPFGVLSEPPSLASPVPEPPAGTFAGPRTAPRNQPEQPAIQAQVTAPGFGRLTLRVQPANASVTIDGNQWLSAKEGEFVIELAVGHHALTVTVPGRATFSTVVEILENETAELNVNLPPAPRTTD
jgi:hypothetical protein